MASWLAVYAFQEVIWMVLGGLTDGFAFLSFRSSSTGLSSGGALGGDPFGDLLLRCLDLERVLLFRFLSFRLLLFVVLLFLDRLFFFSSKCTFEELECLPSSSSISTKPTSPEGGVRGQSSSFFTGTQLLSTFLVSSSSPWLSLPGTGEFLGDALLWSVTELGGQLRRL